MNCHRMSKTLSQNFSLRTLQRLGGGPHDADEIKSHPFFKGINWKHLAEKKVPAPFVPHIRDELDVSNFAEEFTKMTPTDSPAVVPPNFDKIFKGYSYVAPSVLFSENVITEEILRPSKFISTAPIPKSPFFDAYDVDVSSGILGDGSFSVCRRCVEKSTGKEYAVKIISRKVESSREVALLRLCQSHPNIVQLHQVFHDEAHTYIVLELLHGGELLDRIRKKERFTEDEASQIMRKLVSAVHHLHSKNIVHRDLKPENLLFMDESEDSEIKIVDFGFARLKPEKEQTMKTPCFTLHYAAPEVLRHALGHDEEGYDESCDIWSLGVILYTMLSGRAPFQARSRDDSAAAIMARIKGGQFDFNGPEWEHVSPQAKNVTKGMLTVDPAKRLRMEDLLDNAWLEGGMGGLLATPGMLNRSLRGAKEAVTQTFNAFHMAHKQGFRLQDVATARLAQRRKLKKSTDGRSSSSSNFSSTSSGGSCAASKSSVASSSLSKRSSVENDRNFFNFGEARVQEYLSSLPEESRNLVRSSNNSSSHHSNSTSSTNSTSASALSIASCAAHSSSRPNSQSTTTSVASSTTISSISTSMMVPSTEAAVPMEIDYNDPPPPLLKLQAPPLLQQPQLHHRRLVANSAHAHNNHHPNLPSSHHHYHHLQDQVPPLLSPFVHKYEPIMTRSRKRRIDHQACYPNGCSHRNLPAGSCPCAVISVGNGNSGPINLVVASGNINVSSCSNGSSHHHGRSTRFGFADIVHTTTSMETEPINKYDESNVPGTKSKRRKIKLVM